MISLFAGALPFTRPAWACDKSCDAACTTCCKAWSVRALCPDAVAVDASFEDYAVAERVAQGLNAQATSCSGDACAAVRIACPASAQAATWKPVCSADARANDPALTSSYRALLAGAQTLLAAERVALSDVRARIDALGARADLTKKAAGKAAEAAKGLTELAGKLELASSALAAADSPGASADARTDAVARFEELSRKVAEKVSAARRLLAAPDNLDKDFAARAARAESEREKQAAAAEKKQQEQALAAQRKAEDDERKRAVREAKAESERMKAAELAAKEAQARELKDAEAARKEQAAQQKKQAGDAKLASDADTARTDAIAAVAHASSQADAALLGCLKLGAQSDLSAKNQQTAATIRQHLEAARAELNATWSALKGVESEPEPGKRLSSVKKLRADAERLAKKIDVERENLKELIQRHASGH